MYISRRIASSGYTYNLCESYYDPPFYKSRVLLELGPDPSKFITYYSDVAFSVDIEEELAKYGVHTDQFELEELFFRFLTPDAKRWVSLSLKRKRKSHRVKRSFETDEIHWFDRLRLIVLKLDHRNPKELLNEKLPFFTILLDKSRDEIENLLWDMEDSLTFREKVRYFYTVFDLRKYDEIEKRDRAFLDQICSLSQDSQYLMGLTASEVLSYYLSRYIWQYFDMLPWMLSWKRVSRRYSVSERVFYSEREIYEDMSRVLNISVENLMRLSKREILRIFRKKIKELHPDRGGDHEAFIKVRQLMETFLKLYF